MASKIQLAENSLILFTGDSITDCGRARGWNIFSQNTLGDGYVHFAANLLMAEYPQLDLNFVNTGISGNTTDDLVKRWQSDCIDHQPNVLSILIGINDIWRRFDGKPATAVNEADFEKNYHRMLEIVKEKCDCQIVLMQPFMFHNGKGTDTTLNEMFAVLKSYIEIVNQLANEFGASLVPLQDRINEQLPQVDAEKWSNDTVHPYQWAHAWIAQRWLEATGLDLSTT